MRRDIERFEDILEVAGEVAEQVGKGREAFFDSRATRASVERFVEAASRVSAELRVAHPEVPWAEIVGMRNRLVHAYFDVDAEILWDAATIEVPLLAAQVRAILAELGEDEP